jgi:queuine tRNA-ribosyltransferase
LVAQAPRVFELLKTDFGSGARLGRLTTRRGEVETPAFMPVGTQGSVKAMDPRELRETGAQIILSNTYHLAVRPGIEIIRRVGGLHAFMGWPHPILTDSGGYQVFSLAAIRKVGPDGVEFRSHLDGNRLFLGPREVMEIQRLLGTDIAMVLDECPPHDCCARAARTAVERTLRWARGCREQPRAEGQAVFGIVQGGNHPVLREECARQLVGMEFDGYAIGGVSVGEPEPEMLRAVELTVPHLPVSRPRYAMGLGTPAQIVELVARGVDLFDCVLPTRLARNGTAFTYGGAVTVKAGYNKAEPGPIEAGCACFACRHFSRAYLRHLFNVGEILALRMLSVHNVHVYLRLMADIRARIADGTFGEFRREFAAGYLPSKNLRARSAAAASSRPVAAGRPVGPRESARDRRRQLRG